jgi:hypothetical protein
MKKGRTMSDGKHEAGVDGAEITIDGAPLAGAPEPTWLNYVKHYAKAVVAAILSGLTYLVTVLAPAATVGDITLLQWIGFWISFLGTFAGTAAVTNGAKPQK